ncbi:T-complex protein 1 subunit eta [Cinnamomum micranthum f. kanehirae]|uniref:T-complex protein 1 subunit eta n=1 Tax=Cinnamomum micranthum f. kanehirae TaxID=337451 RepID=A0A443PIV5_9MAGN|nr:T-complex protein 1 subunit eta [Cinnamomum micranthum f. kanehirae]
MAAMLQPQIILLKEGTDTSQGKAQLVSNINACTVIADVVRTTLGPRGMDKLIHDDKGNTTISNDGATIMKLLDIVHPAAKILVDIAKSQDSEGAIPSTGRTRSRMYSGGYLGRGQRPSLIGKSRHHMEGPRDDPLADRLGYFTMSSHVMARKKKVSFCTDVVLGIVVNFVSVGDGTTTVVLLAAEFLKEAKPYVEDGVHPQNLIRSYRTASYLAINKIKELAVSIEGKSLEEKKGLLAKCAATTLSSKLIGGEKDFFASMVVDAVIAIGYDDRLNLIGIKKVPGGNMRDSFLVNGVAFKKTFSYAGFEQQPKKFLNPKILLLNIELELKSEKENAEVRLSDPLQYQSIVDAEWNIIYDKLDKCVQSGAKIVLSRLAIGDLATQYFADRDIFCAGRVTEEDLQRVAAATGGTVQTSVNNIVDEVLGSCELFEEKQVGNERFNIFSGCPSGLTATIVLRGGADQFIEEAERSLHDAIMIVRRALKNSTVVAGGGAIDIIPRQLCDNAGFDATDVLNKLRQKHALPSGEGANYGVDINTGGIADSFANFVWEPSVVKINAINAATEAACLILSVDETVKNPKSESAQGEAAAGAMGRGRGGAAFRGRGRGMRRR